MPSLPFIGSATLRSQDGSQIAANVPMTIWPVGGGNDASGRYYDHQAETPIGYYDQLSDENVKVEADGERYAVVECVRHTFMPHCALFLRQGRNRG